MDIENSKPLEIVPAPAAPPAPAAVAPVAPAAPAVAATPTATPAPAPVATVPGEIRKTDGKTPGGWNRFAGYKPGDNKNKKNDRRDSSKGRR